VYVFHCGNRIGGKMTTEEFIKEMEGCIKEGTPTINPLDLKKMWEPKTAT
jgi:hypothetical protein